MTITPAVAQPQAMAPASGPATEVDASDMVQGGQQAIRMIDESRLDALWSGATAAARQRSPQREFTRQVGKLRAGLGEVAGRQWVVVHRQTVASDEPDLAGEYVSVEFETRFTAQPDKVLRELVTFHLDRDRVWRFSGYVLR